MTSMLYRGELVSPYRPLAALTAHNRWLAAQACPMIQRILHGRRAAELIDQVPAGGGMLVTLPMWLWMMPAAGALGKKSGDVMPARVTFSGDSSCVLIAEDPADIGYRASGLGREASGTVRIEESFGLRDDSTAPETATTIPEEIVCRRLDADEITQRLREIEASGHEAWWSLLMEMETFVRKAVKRSHGAATRELHESLGVGKTGLLDPEGLEEVVNQVILEDSGRTSPAMKVIDRLLEPDRFRKVDPQKYLSTELSRTAGQRLRARIGDPHIGQRIRSLMVQMPEATEDQLLDAYRTKRPEDSLGIGRLREALSVEPDLSMRSVPLTEEACASPDDSYDPLVHLSREQSLKALADLDLTGSIEDIEVVRTRILDAVDIAFLDDGVVAGLILDAMEARR